MTVRVDPSNVKLELSSKAPDVPAITTLLSVRSETVAEAAVSSPPNVDIPALLKLSQSTLPTTFIPTLVVSTRLVLLK